MGQAQTDQPQHGERASGDRTDIAHELARLQDQERKRHEDQSGEQAGAGAGHAPAEKERGQHGKKAQESQGQAGAEIPLLTHEPDAFCHAPFGEQWPFGVQLLGRFGLDRPIGFVGGFVGGFLGRFALAGFLDRTKALGRRVGDLDLVRLPETRATQAGQEDSGRR